MKLKKIIFVIITILIIYLMFVSMSFGATITVNADVLKIRDTPSTTGKVLGNLVKGDTVEVVSQSGDWYKIKYGNDSKTGYVYKDYVTLKGSISGNTTNNTTNNTTTNTANNTTTNTNNTTNTTSNNTINNTTNTNTTTSDNTISGNTTQSTTSNQPTTDKIMLSSGSSMHILPSFISSTILKVNADSDMEALEIINNWTRIKCDDMEGWVYNKDIINFDKIAINTGNEQGGTTQQKTGKINVSSVNVRKSASTTATVLTSLSKNKEVTVLGQSGDWYQIKTANGTIGYVLAEYITII